MLNVPYQKVADCPSRHGMSDNIAPSLTLRVCQVFKQVLRGCTNGFEFGNETGQCSVSYNDVSSIEFFVHTIDRSLAIAPGGSQRVAFDFSGQPAPTGILITHAHPDHIGGLPKVQQATDAEVWCHPLEKPVIEGKQPIVVGFLIDLSNNTRIHWKTYQDAILELVWNLMPGDKRYTGYLISYANDAELRQQVALTAANLQEPARGAAGS